VAQPSFTVARALGQGESTQDAAAVFLSGQNADGSVFFGPPVDPIGRSGTGTTQVGQSSSGAAATVTATLTGAASVFTYLSYVYVGGLGATAAGTSTITITGLSQGTMTLTLPIPAGATVGVTPFQITFPIPLISSAANTNIVVSATTFGAGNTSAQVTALGFTA